MKLDVLVIGGGQAGLATARHLSKTTLTYVVVEGGQALAASWLSRYESLTLFTTRAFSSLPDMALSGDPDAYATRLEFADYLKSYGKDLPVLFDAQVKQLSQLEGGGFEAVLEDGRILQAFKVVVATGAFQSPIAPLFASSLTLQQFTAESYHHPADVHKGPVLVVGDGASGRDIAAELAQNGHDVTLSSGRQRRLFPERMLGKSIWWWLDITGLLRAPATSWIGKKMRAADAFPDRNRSQKALRKLGVRFSGRAVCGAGRTITFENGESFDYGTVIWCIGYRDEIAWMDIPEAVSDGSFLHCEGVSPVPGLYYVGRPWQRNRASGLIMGVGEDSKIIVQAILKGLADNK